MTKKHGPFGYVYKRVLPAVILSFSAALSLAQEYTLNPELLRLSKSQAQLDLSAFAKSGDFLNLGLNNPEELRAAALGDPIKEFLVPLEKLQQFESDQNPLDLLQDTGKVTYPVVVGQDAKSSITLQWLDQKWATQSSGDPEYIRLMTSIRSDLAKLKNRNKADYFEVKVPALKVYFVGELDNGKLMLTPIRQDTRFKLSKGRSLPAEQAFKAIAPEAKKREPSS